ncbi:ATP-binding Cassette (ABC) Superfamily, partial [Achlya hypogyna]
MSSKATYQSVAVDAKTAKVSAHPLQTAGLFSKVTFGWANALLALGHERQLDPEDLWPLEAENQCKVVSAVFEPKFKANRSILRTILSLYGWRLFWVGVLQALTLGCTLYGPVVLKAILTAVEGPSFNLVLVLQYVVSLFAVKALQAILTAHANLANQIITVKITSALQHLLFQKALVLDAKCRREKTAGEISNMFSSDIQWIISFAMFTNQIWLIPLQLAVVLAMLYAVIGWAAFVGAAVILFTLLSNNVLANAQRRAFKRLMAQKDDRMKAVNEVFGAMQILKLNAWEEKFGEKIDHLRRAEVSTLRRLVTLTSVQVGFLYSAPVLVTVASFAIYAMVMQESLTAAKVFTALSLFTLLRGPMMFLPQI